MHLPAKLDVQKCSGKGFGAVGTKIGVNDDIAGSNAADRPLKKKCW
jgi:hypothetical protein